MQFSISRPWTTINIGGQKNEDNAMAMGKAISTRSRTRQMGLNRKKLLEFAQNVVDAVLLFSIVFSIALIMFIASEIAGTLK